MPARSPLAVVTAPPLRTVDLLAVDAPVQVVDATSPLRARLAAHPMIRLTVFVFVMGFLIVTSVLLVTSVNPDPTTVVLSTLQLVSALVAYLLVVGLLERRQPPFELAPDRALGLGLGLLFGAALFLTCYLVIMAAGGFRVAGAGDGVPWAAVWQLGVVAGVSEELMFRGILFRLVEEWLGTWIALVVSAVIFGAVHLANPGATAWGAIAIALEAGLLFGALYVLTRSLWVGIGVHAAWNVVQGPVLGVVVSGGGVSGGLVRTEVTGPEWLTGGAFGAEASLVTVVLLLAVTAWLLGLARRRGLVVAPSWERRRLLAR